MSLSTECCAPCQPVVTNVPGVQGDDGTAGTNGTDGINAFTLLVSTVDVPMNAGDAVSFTVAENSWMAEDQVLFLSDGTDRMTVRTTGFTGSTQVSAVWIDAPNDSVTGSEIGIGGKVSPGGEPGELAAALPTALTDSTTGTASNVLTAGAGQFTHSVFFRAAAITGNVLLYTYTPGYAFKILRISASVVDAITTGAKAATLTTAIAGTPTTGGIVIMSGTYALGAEQASSAAITANNEGSSIQAITVTASAVTPFTEGGFMLHFQIQNMDSANALASLADHINDLITSLT